MERNSPWCIIRSFLQIAMNILEFLQAIDGLGQLWTNNGQFLGVLSSDQYDPNSICNPNGTYGSSYFVTSIHNPSGLYGSTWGINSPYNPNSLCPPAVVYQGRIVGFVTKNHHLCTNGVPIIHPDLLIAAYSSTAHAAPNPHSVYTQIYCNNLNFIASLSRSIGCDLPMDNRNLH